MERIFEALEASVPGLVLPARDGAAFPAGVAEPLIRATFDSVERTDYSFEMAVDDPEAIVSYAASAPAVQAVSLSLDAWVAYIETICPRRSRGRGRLG